MLKISLLFKEFTDWRVNNSRIVRIENAKLSGSCFYMKINVQGDLHISELLQWNQMNILDNAIFIPAVENTATLDIIFLFIENDNHCKKVL